MATLAEAIAAHRAGDLHGAAQAYLSAPESHVAHHNLGLVFYALGRLSEAETAFRKALALKSGDAATTHGLSLTLLALGRYAEAWPLFEARREDPAGGSVLPDLPLPEWRGETLEGRRLLVIGDQGFGDQIMFSRFLPQLVRLGAQVTLAPSPEVAPVLQHLPARVLPALLRSALSDVDLWTPLASLPFRLAVTRETVPPPADLGQPTSRGGGVGVIARGRPTYWNDAHRSLPPAATQRLLSLGRDLHPDATGAKDFLETARLMADLDLVISVDTSTAHLAATLGKPTVILVPRRALDWRWRPEGAPNPRYPQAMLLRQDEAGDWADALTAAEARAAQI